MFIHIESSPKKALTCPVPKATKTSSLLLGKRIMFGDIVPLLLFAMWNIGWYVDDNEVLNNWCNKHPIEIHLSEGIMIFALPVSNTTSNSWGGFPIVILLEYSVNFFLSVWVIKLLEGLLNETLFWRKWFVDISEWREDVFAVNLKER